MPDEKSVSVCLSFDFDAMSSWIAGYRTDSPNALSRGEFGKVGAQRLLDLLEEHGVLTTWFVPGHTIEAFPEVVERIVQAGHEIAHHGYCHEDPRPLERSQEAAILERGSALIEQASGARPRGYRCPSGSFSRNTLELLLEHGFLYDSSLLGDDFTPYYCRIGHRAPHDAPYVFGEPIDLVELPFSWHLDDHPYFEHTRSKRGVNPGLAEPSRVEEVWKGDFDYLYGKMGAGIFILTMHPQVIGRGNRLLMLERLVAYMEGHEGVRFERMVDYASAWRKENPLS